MATSSEVWSELVRAAWIRHLHSRTCKGRGKEERQRTKPIVGEAAVRRAELADLAACTHEREHCSRQGSGCAQQTDLKEVRRSLASISIAAGSRQEEGSDGAASNEASAVNKQSIGRRHEREASSERVREHTFEHVTLQHW